MGKIGSCSLSQPHWGLGMRMGTFGIRVIRNTSK